MKSRPKKNLYPDQTDVWNKAQKHLVELVNDKPCVQEAIVWASLAEGKFGLYEEPYGNREVSDIDLVVIIDEDFPLPKTWKFTTVKKSCFDLYKLGYFEYQNHTHPIDGLLVFPSRHNLKEVRAMLTDRCKSIYLKSGISLLEELDHN